MKKTLFICVSLLAVLIAASCASTGTVPPPGGSPSTPNQNDSRLPQYIRNARKNAPEDALIGVGTAKMATLNQSRTISATRARADISRVLDTIIRDMVRDYEAGSEVDHSAVVSFDETITVSLSQARLVGAFIVEEDYDADGNYWTVVMLSKNNAVNEINQAVSAAKLRVPAMASFDAERRMDEYYDKTLKDLKERERLFRE
ncbi:MAG: hypothetical protein LBB81_10820 [Treponema sp.]|jgi:hypothetical protein|nr:hypothetical protein [Treponema sp.]